MSCCCASSSRISTAVVGALVVLQSARPVALGLLLGCTLTLGLGAALLATPAAEQIGSTVQLFDPVAYGASLLCIVAACALAALVPAQIRIEPVQPAGSPPGAIESNPKSLLCYSCDNFVFHRLRKLCRSMGRKSRPLVHAGASGTTFWISRPTSELRLYKAGLIITLAHNLNAIRSAVFRLLPLLVISLRRCNSNWGMSIFTGQTSRHAPHKLDAYGSCAVFWKPINCGVITAPIGPGYTDPYA